MHSQRAARNVGNAENLDWLGDLLALMERLESARRA
jgi:hypothetical protein